MRPSGSHVLFTCCNGKEMRRDPRGDPRGDPAGDGCKEASASTRVCGGHLRWPSALPNPPLALHRARIVPCGSTCELGSSCRHWLFMSGAKTPVVPTSRKEAPQTSENQHVCEPQGVRHEEVHASEQGANQDHEVEEQFSHNGANDLDKEQTLPRSGEGTRTRRPSAMLSPWS